MNDSEKRDYSTALKMPVDENLIYPNPKTASEPAILSMKDIENDEKSHKIHKPTKWYSIASFIFTLIPIILCAYCIIYYYTNRKPDILGTDFTSLVFTYMILYYYTIGLPLAGCAIGMGIAGLKNGLPKLAKLSLFLKTCYIIIVILFMSGVIRF